MATTPRRPAQATRGAISAPTGMHIGNSVYIFQGAGVPTDGTSGDGAGWAGPGSLYLDRTNGELYTNQGTEASPTWVNQT